MDCFQSVEVIDPGYCTSLFLYTLEFDFDGIDSVHAFEFEVGVAPIDRPSAPALEHNDVRENVVVREKISSFLLWEWIPLFLHLMRGIKCLIGF